MNSWGKEDKEGFVSISERGIIKLTPLSYGYTQFGSELHSYLPSEWTAHRTLVIAGTHGEEANTTSVLSHAFRSLNPSYLHCAVVLCVNPDGMSHATRGNARGVDINRNFPAKNWRQGKVTHKWEEELPQITELQAGSAPASESETASLIQLIQSNSIKQIISIHSPLHCVNYEQTEAWPLVDELSKRLALPIVDDVGYPCPGSMDAWATEVGLRFVTLELEHELSMFAIRKKYGPVIQDILRGAFPGL